MKQPGRIKRPRLRNIRGRKHGRADRLSLKFGNNILALVTSSAEGTEKQAVRIWFHDPFAATYPYKGAGFKL
jgi:hypothetical protein